jgi:hemoglobin-like flavoprotein
MNTAAASSNRPFRPQPESLLDARAVAKLADSLPQTWVEEAWLAERFYGGLLAAHPGLRSMFSPDLTLQARKLLASVRFVLANAARPGELGPQLATLGARHAEYGAQPEHYGIVCERLADALAELRGGDRELRELWFGALQRVATAMCPAA